MVSVGIGMSFGVVYGEEEMPQGGQGKGNPMMKGMGMMHKDSLVATEDGGVVLMQGPRLIKYDKDLNLIKEVEIPRGKKPAHHEMQNEEPAAEDGAPA